MKSEEFTSSRCNNIALTPDEEKIYLSHPQIGKSLLANIPRLEEIAEAIAFQDRSYKKIDDDQKSLNIAVIAKLLKHAVELDKTFEEEKRKPGQGTEPAKISPEIQTPETQTPETRTSETRTIETQTNFEKVVISAGTRKYIIRTLPLRRLRPGMILAEDLVDKSGVRIVSKGTEISDVLILRLTNFITLNRISEFVNVFISIE